MRLSQEDFVRDNLGLLITAAQAAIDGAKGNKQKKNKEIIELAFYNVYLKGYTSGVKDAVENNL